MIYRVLFFLCLTLQIKAQPNFQWAKAIGGNTADDAYGVTTDFTGNVYTVGSFNGAVDFDPGPGVFTITGQKDVFISKLDASGSFVWAKAFGAQGADHAQAIYADSLGNTYIIGTFQGTVDFNPGPAVYTLTSVWGNDVFVLKLDSGGNFLWAKSIEGTSGETCSSMAVDKNGYIYIVGYFSGTADFDPSGATYTLSCSGTSAMFISKMDNSGAFVWAEAIGGGASYTMGHSITLDKFGNIYTTGSFNGTLDFDPGPAVYNLTTYNNNSDNAFILKLNSSGNFIWAKELWGTNSIGRSVAVDQLGYVYTTGYFSGTIDFDPNGGIVYLSAVAFAGDAFVSKLDQSGNFIWAKKIGGKNNEYGTCISVDVSGKVYVAGNFNDTVDFNPGPTINNLISSGASDAFILLLDSSGQFITAKKVGGVVNDYINSLHVNMNGDIYTTGTFGITANFDTDGGVFNLVSSGNNDVFIHKMSNGVQAIAENKKEIELAVFPNPTAAELFIICSKPGTLSVKNLLGQNVTDETVIKEGTTRIDLTGLDKGIYFLQLSGNFFSQLKKIIKE
ncbi:MAG: SBBP repeat-containing protein [Bacteroidetes bacterium]|nr:SBBP repeat-containing protein [Bacteroidota bacterium]